MPITVECGQCKKKYRVADTSAGKKVKCKACGNTFLVPAALADAPAASAPGMPPALPAGAVRQGAGRAQPQRIEVEQGGDASFDDVAAFAALESVGAAMAPLPPVSTGAFTEPPPPPPPSPRKSKTAYGRTVSAPDTGSAPSYLSPYDPARFNRRANHGYNVLRDAWLPRALVFCGYVVPVGFWLYSDFTNPGTSKHLLGTLISVGLMVGIAIPTMGLGLLIAARLTHFEPVEGARFKTFAAFCTPLTLAFVFAHGAASGAIVTRDDAIAFAMHALTGFLLGIVLSLFVLWYLLRVKLLQAIVSWIFSGVFFIIGSALSVLGFAAIVVGLKSAGDAIMNEANTPSQQSAQATPDVSAPTPNAEESPAQARDRALQAARQQSDANLRQIIAALRQYTATHDGKYPATLDELARAVPEVSAYFQSPVDPLSTSGYAYLYLLKMTAKNTPDDVALVYDQDDLQKSGETSVAFADGTLKRMSSGELDAARARALDVKRVEPNAVATTENPAVAPMPPVVGNPTAPPVQPDTPTVTGPAQPAPFCKITPDAGDEKKKLAAPLSVNIPIPEGSSADIFYSTPTGHCVMVGTNSYVTSWDLIGGGNHIGLLKDHLPSKDVAFSPDGATMVLLNPAAPNGGEMGVFSFTTGGKLNALHPENGVAGCKPVGFLGNSQLITSTSNPKPMLQTWDLKTGVKQHDVEIPAADGLDAVRAFSATGRYYAVPVEQRIKIFNLATGEQDADLALPAGSSQVRALCFSTNGAELTAIANGASGGSNVVVYDLTAAGGGNCAAIPMVGSTALGRHDLQYLPDKSGWLLDDQALLDRVSGKVFYMLPPLKAGLLEGRAIRMLDLYNVLIECPPQGTSRAVIYRSVKLSKADIDDALKAARQSVKPAGG